MAIEIDNAKEEIKEIVEKCIRCGMCNQKCPVLRVMREEWHSPRGFVVLLDSGVFEKIIYDCTLCKACEMSCPLDLKLCSAFIKARGVLVSSGKGLDKNKEMIKNLEKRGNVFGVENG